MKEKRQRAIREILSTRSVSTQQELMDALQEKSISATQATLSRDIRELGIVKQQDESGKTRYCLPRAGRRQPSLSAADCHRSGAFGGLRRQYCGGKVPLRYGGRRLRRSG